MIGEIPMKRFSACLLVLGMLLCACGQSTPPLEPAPDTTAATQAAQTQPATQSTQQSTEAPAASAPVYLKVSSLTFALVGESEDIYLGLAPREEILWQSDDPSIVSVENGVLTATGVGTTTIHASLDDQQLDITAGCLAETQEELDALGFDVLCHARRLPPELDLDAPCTSFDNAAIVGDSITYMMMQTESKGNYLGNILFLARGGTSLNGFVQHSKNVYYQGGEMNLEDAIASSAVERIFVLIGSNDIASDPQREAFFDNWDILLERIRDKSPELEIVLISNIPQYAIEQESWKPRFQAYNRYVQELNAQLEDYCRENGCLYLDLCYYMQDFCGRLPQEYNLDGYHLNDTGYKTWMKILRYYAQYELEGGSFT